MVQSLYEIQWTEYERGWGQRPDGTSYHATLEEAEQYIKEYWEEQPDGSAPDCYSSPGMPKLVEVSDEIMEAVEENGIHWQN